MLTGGPVEQGRHAFAPHFFFVVAGNSGEGGVYRHNIALLVQNDHCLGRLLNRRCGKP